MIKTNNFQEKLTKFENNNEQYLSNMISSLMRLCMKKKNLNFAFNVYFNLFSYKIGTIA